MNLLIFDPSYNKPHFIFHGHKSRFRNIICVNNIRELFTCLTRLPSFSRPFSVVVLIVPAIRIRQNGTVVPRSRRAEIILEVARAAAYAHINTVIFPRPESPVAFFDRATGEKLSGDEVFFRPIDQTTNTFRGCFVGRDWEQIVKSAIMEE